MILGVDHKMTSWVWSLFGTGLCLIAASVFAVHSPALRTSEDGLDRDGLRDELEQTLAERYAPIVLHEPDEPNFPIDAETYLRDSELWYFDNACSPKARPVAPPHAVISALEVQSCGFPTTRIRSFATFSLQKDRTFFLRPRNENLYCGTTDTRRWITYYHAYRSRSGVTLQYWRFFAYNSSYFIGLRMPVGNHEGDWEAIHVVLGPSPDYAPEFVRFLGHSSIDSLPSTAIVWQGSHPVILSAKGGHTSMPASKADLTSGRMILQETWTGGMVRWPSGRAATPAGPLLNLGEKTSPKKGMEFLLYSGLWGRRETGWLGQHNSGYWGPAYNETGRQRNGFVTAWCEGILDSSKRVGEVRECYP